MGSLALVLAACAGTPQKPQPRETAPPPMLVVRLDRVALRTTAWTELHAWLATRAGDDEPTLDFAPAVRDYHDAQDESGAKLEAARDELAACEDAKCAHAAMQHTPFARAFDAAFEPFYVRKWGERAAAATRAVEAARGALGPESDAMAERVAHDLGARWPETPIPVDVVAETPAAAHDELLPTFLAARHRCFSVEKTDTDRMYTARIIDCVLARAALQLRSSSSLFDSLTRVVPAESLDRAWTMIVVHAVASVVTAWEPKHQSSYRRSAAAVESHAMAWLVDHWREREQPSFAASLAAMLAER